nr:unnamed protein product [Callosobruchus chinensis]
MLKRRKRIMSKIWPGLGRIDPIIYMGFYNNVFKDNQNAGMVGQPNAETQCDCLEEETEIKHI